MRETLLLGLLLILTGCSGAQTNPHVKLCKVCFGTGDDDFILVGRTKDSLLIFRDGNPDSEPETYLMQGNKLDLSKAIPAFEFGKATYSVKNCFEFKDEQQSRHSLMIWMKVETEQCTFTQYCDITLKSRSESLDLARFDGMMSIAPQTVKYIPVPIVFKIGGEPTDVRVCIGTVEKAVGCWTVLSVQDENGCAFPEDVRPAMVIDFPASDGKTITKQYVLDEYC